MPVEVPLEKNSVADWAKTEIAVVYDGAAATYDRIGPSFFSYFAGRVVAQAEIRRESRVLDVATGSGAVLVQAAALVGRNGSVTGIDLSPRMVDRTRAEIRARGLAHCEVLVGDAESLPFAESSFDRVLCSFAIFLLCDLHRALTEFHRVLAPSGKVGLVYSESPDEEWQWYDDLLREYGASADLATERYDPRTVEVALTQIGFGCIATSVDVCHLRFANSDSQTQ